MSVHTHTPKKKKKRFKTNWGQRPGARHGGAHLKSIPATQETHVGRSWIRLIPGKKKARDPIQNITEGERRGKKGLGI
jgi:hypothetical protein